MDWFLYDNGLRHERVNQYKGFMRNDSYYTALATPLWKSNQVRKAVISFEIFATT